jgi:2-polyprenyl-3-methyl-5-hydroxy-6-metoxy-1,4-benzoquinol methylase
MERCVETELMTGVDQVWAYNASDKQPRVAEFLSLYQEKINISQGKIIDLGCGTGDYLVGLARKYPGLTIVGYDGSDRMVQQAQKNTQGLDISIICKQFDAIVDRADCVISVNTLHHLHDPMIFWQAVESISTRVLVTDLVRPANTHLARTAVETIVGGDSEVFKTDFYNSLLAAFSAEEILQQVLGTGYTVEFRGNPKFLQTALIYTQGTDK